MKFNSKKYLLTALLTIVFGLCATTFAAVGYIKDSSLSEKDQPVYYKINPVFWLPAYFIIGPEISDPQYISALLITFPYWITISYLISIPVIKI